MGSRRMSSTVMLGLSEPTGSWNMYWTRQRYLKSSSSLSRVTRNSRPRSWNRISPLSGMSARTISFPSVDFPLPLSPTSPRDSPRRIPSETSFTALTDGAGPPIDQADCLAPNAFVTRSSSSMYPEAGWSPGGSEPSRFPSRKRVESEWISRSGTSRWLLPRSMFGTAPRSARVYSCPGALKILSTEPRSITSP